MTPYYEDSGITIFHARAEDVLPTLGRVFTALVTDPPAGVSFMGKTWDHDHGGRAGWVAAFAAIFGLARAALLPGAPGLVWALPRTSHWTGCALEDAGFELRDNIAHVFSQGFPKSLSISKSIDKAAGAEHLRTFVSKNPADRPYTYTKGETSTGWKSPVRPDKTAPATPEAATWDGWGTSLAPGHEAWWLVMNPREGTFANNALAHGTGGLNIDGSRVGTEVTRTSMKDMTAYHGNKFGEPGARAPITGYKDNPPGRWPSNFLLSHSAACVPGRCAAGCVVASMDRQSGVSVSKRTYRGDLADIRGNNYSRASGNIEGSDSIRGHDGTGGASKFFPTFYPDPPFRYEGKASKRDRGPGNTHPTVKATALMRWLLTLVTQPERNLVLDPFGGSGSTAVACKQLGLPCVVIEQDEAHCETIARRLRLARYGSAEMPPAPPTPTPEQHELF